MTEYRGKWLYEPEQILFEVEDAVATITFNRPDKRNALNGKMLKEMHDALLEADDRMDVNAIVLCGAGKDFCAGYDLEQAYEGRGEKTKLGNYQYREAGKRFDDDCFSMERTQQYTLIIPAIHKPVIAKVHGNCLAGGTDIALSCDLVIMADDARIGFPATRANGSPPAHMWIYHCGPQWAKRMLFTGDKMTGADAVKIGLALESWPAAELDAAVDALARRVAAVDQELLSAHKRIVNLALEQMGAGTIQRLAAEADARAHLAAGPRRTQFKSDMKEHGLKVALTNRDAPFGDGYVRVKGS
ncbi:crotonase/enoyl-CoA hydratase family protein [Novosphingobium taihuense]|uniref:Enoyl-CoA hydratase n=1 Tax=Novosphingobium taihuense TaxID=260085 RepID=A0A7W7ADK4_9SPHN|nr:crotonase/enoyl-CoA hydratase family protein [Novosphingobium taihuense]MBB4615007.1 enoyl-CoA hydratase [Novosphingobium taihuense]TWH84552.1 enoyl-CoA hydratase [Novosphingobium taihuense]